MNTTEVLEAIPALTRDLLYSFERRGWITPNRVKRGRLKGRDYPESEIEKLSYLIKGYAAGLAPERAFELARSPEMLRSERLLGLLKASEKILESGLLLNAGNALNDVVRGLRAVVEAEACALFLIRADFPEELDLTAHSADTGEDYTPSTVPIENQRGGGLTSWVAHEKKLVNLYGAKLRGHPYYWAKQGFPHLASGERFSFLMVPIRDRKNRIVGWLRCENRKAADERPNAVTFFDPLDTLIVELLATEIAVVLESARLMTVSRELIKAGTRARSSLQEFLIEILRKSVSLVGADRGDVFRWDDGSKSFVLVAQVGGSTLHIGEVLAYPSIPVGVFYTLEPRLVEDVSRAANYCRCHDRTRSVLAVPLNLTTGCLGVLNLESFQLNGFDAQDVEVLRYLTETVAPAASMLENRVAV